MVYLTASFGSPINEPVTDVYEAVSRFLPTPIPNPTVSISNDHPTSSLPFQTITDEFTKYLPDLTPSLVEDKEGAVQCFLTCPEAQSLETIPHGLGLDWNPLPLQLENTNNTFWSWYGPMELLQLINLTRIEFDMANPERNPPPSLGLYGGEEDAPQSTEVIPEEMIADDSPNTSSPEASSSTRTVPGRFLRLVGGKGT
ncbi:hypothetical protein M231_01976 [Tremella mesenterica]|uniref:Uncharacterized protein n=1 Tax=Tremella mesenterica TaxID=5217 RepID=A0A4Q1BRW3_TREME|nr:hypothetical protein M231_01976 [Tremella mesenterica]